MKTVQINNTKLVLYSSIKELPVSRYKCMQNYILQDSGIGNTMADVDRHLQNTIMFLSAGKTDDCKDELTNLHYTFFAMINGIDFKTKSFACIVKQIGEVLCDDISTDGLNATVETIIELGATNEDVDNVWTDVKKNLIPN